MANLSKDIQCAGSDTRPPMLDRTDFALWQQRIRLYCRGKENGPEYVTFEFYSDLSPEDKERFVTSVKLNRGLRDSNYDQSYAYLKQHEAHANENKMMLDQFHSTHLDPLALMSCLNQQTSSNTRNQATVQDGRVVVQNVQGRQNRGQGNNAQGGGVAGYGGAHNRVGNANPGQARQIKCYNYNGIGGQDNAIDEDVDEQPVQDLALNVDNVFQADDCDAFDSDVDEAPTAQTMFMANLSSADPVYDEAGPSYDSDILSEDNAMPVVQSNVYSVPNDAYMMIYNDMYEPHAQFVSKTTWNTVVDNSLTAELATYKEQVELYERRARSHQDKSRSSQKADHSLKTNQSIDGVSSKYTYNAYIFEELEAEIDQNVVDRKHDEIEQKNLLIANDNLIADCLQRRALDFHITQLTEKVTILQEQNELFRAENGRIKQLYKELHDSIKIMRVKHIEQTTTLTTENENLKAQIQNKVKSVTKDHVKPIVLAPGKYAIDVEPIPPRNRNNRAVHLDYLRHLKESVETLREIVEEAKVERHLDRSMVSAFRYTENFC
ncbi:hypothetical protein Tco_0267710 [Tanacetum coccineum]